MIRRNTIQRALVLDAVNQLRNHATADEIYEKIASEHPHIGRGTVYRNLQLLAESGEILKVEVPGGADRYDHSNFRHYHVRCQKCGKVFDVDMPYDEGMEQKIADKRGFILTGHSIMFSGICPACQKESSESK